MKCCEEYAIALSAFADGELSDTEREKVLSHAEQCEACRSYLVELAAMRAALDDMEEVEVPEGFAAGVLARARETKKQHTGRAAGKAWRSLAACAAIVLLAGALTLPRFSEKKTADVAECAPAPASEPQAAAEESYSADGAMIQYHFAVGTNTETPAEMKTTAAAAAKDAHAVVFALSDEAESFLVSHGCALYEETAQHTVYLAPVELVREMAETGLIDEKDEALAFLSVAEGSVEVVIRMEEDEGADDAPAETAESTAAADTLPTEDADSAAVEPEIEDAGVPTDTADEAPAKESEVQP